MENLVLVFEIHIVRIFEGQVAPAAAAEYLFVV